MSTYSNETGRGGWNCVQCDEFILWGTPHTCPAPRYSKTGDLTFEMPTPLVLDRVEALLERIVELLERDLE